MSANNILVHRPKLSTIIAISIGIMLSVPALFGTFYLFQSNMTQATDSLPRDVVISEITTTTAKVSWTTDQEVQSVIEYGTSPSALVFYAPETKKTKDHHVELDLLTPKTTHYFQIRVDAEVYDNAGSPWTFITKSTGTEQGSSQTVIPTQGLIGSQQVLIPTKASSGIVTTGQNSCKETDCRKIQQNFGKGCTISDYIRCLNSSSAPTATPSGSTTTTGTTPTVTPTSFPKADLLITSVDNLCLGSTGSNAKVEFKLTVKNQGNLTASEHKLQIDFDKDGASDLNEYARDVTVEIEPNASYPIEGETTMSGCTKCKADHDAKLTIDFDGDVSESNEVNNTYYKSITMCDT